MIISPRVGGKDDYENSPDNLRAKQKSQGLRFRDHDVLSLKDVQVEDIYIEIYGEFRSSRTCHNG